MQVTDVVRVAVVELGVVHGEAEHARVALAAHQTHRAVEHRVRLGRRLRDDGNGDRVGALLQVVHRRRFTDGHRSLGKRDLVVVQVRVRVQTDAGGAQVALHAVAEHFHPVHVDHAAVQVAQRDHEASHVIQRSHTKRLLVQLDLVRRPREAAHRTCIPTRRLSIKPVRWHLIHLVKPLRGRRHRPLREDHAVVAEAQVGVVVQTRDRLVLVVGQQRVHVHSGGLDPGLARAADIDLVLRVRQTEERRPVLVRHLTRVRSHAQHHLLRRHVLDRERLLLRARLVRADDAH